MIVAHWADEATKAAANEETNQARRHESEDADAARQRVEKARGPAGLLRRTLRRLRSRRR